jgi:hypothetical protein
MVINDDASKILTTERRSLIKEVSEHSSRIELVIAPYRAPADGFSDEEYSAAQAKLWNEYIYPRFLPIYQELFPDAGEKLEGESHAMLRYGEMMGVAFCEWLRREGFFHIFEKKIYFVIARNVFEVYPAGASFICFSLDEAALALHRLADKLHPITLNLWLKQLIR